MEAATPWLLADPAAEPAAAPVAPVPLAVVPSVMPAAVPAAAPLEAPAGSSGLVPVRPGAAPAVPVAPVGYVPGAPVPTSAPARLRWDEKGARRRASATTFGLTGRIVITVVVVLLVAVLSYGNVFGIPLFLAAAAWLLRDLWSKARVVPPRAPAAGSAPRPSAFPPAPPTS